MKRKLTIGLILMITVMLVLAPAVTGEKIMPSSMDEQTFQTKEFATFECDPCDYNIDYGKESDTIQQDSLKEGLVKVACDPCDYNIDFGKDSPENR